MVIRKLTTFQVWMRKNWMWFIPTVSLIGGAIFNTLIYPLVVAFWAFVGNINVTIADTNMIKPKVLAHEQVIFEIKGSLGTLVKQNDLIINGKYRDIKDYIDNRDASLNKR